MKKLLAVSCLVFLVYAAAANAAVEVVVTPSNMDGWTFYTTDSSGSLASPGTGTANIVNGPATPPLGTGSAHLMTPSGGGDESAQMRNTSWAGTAIADLTSLSYSTYGTSWNGQQLTYVTLWLDTDGDTLLDDRLHFEPAYSESGAGNANPYAFQGPAALGVWQTWDMLQGMWYSDSVAGPGSNAESWDFFKLLYPLAKIIDAAPGVGGVRVTSGFGSPGDDFETNVDAFTIGTAAETIIYNFETQDVGAVPEPASLAVWSLLGMVGAGRYWWRRNRRG